MNDKQINEQVEAIKRTGAKIALLCKFGAIKFLLDTGILEFEVLEDFDGLGL